MMLTQAARPEPTNSLAIAVASTLAGNVVSATTISFIRSFLPVHPTRNLIQRASMPDLLDSAPESEPTAPRRPRVRHRLRTPLEARQWRRRITGYALFGVSVVLVVNALVGENGYLATFSGRRDQAELTAELRQLREENSQSAE